MHIRIDQKRFEQILAGMQIAIDRNLEAAENHSWPQASGIARGGLVSAMQMLLTSKQWDTHPDMWDDVESEVDAQIAEEQLVPAIPDWPSIYAEDKRTIKAALNWSNR